MGKEEGSCPVWELLQALSKIRDEDDDNDDDNDGRSVQEL